MSTQAIFQDSNLPRNTPKLDIDSLMQQNWSNDCQKLVTLKHPQVANALGWLVEYAPSRMTGTGACVFGEFEQQQTALDALAQLPSRRGAGGRPGGGAWLQERSQEPGRGAGSRGVLESTDSRCHPVLESQH